MKTPSPTACGPVAGLVLLSLAAACQSAASSAGTPDASPGHLGPPVAMDSSGPARFLAQLDDQFDAERAMSTVAYADGYYRVRGSDGYNAVLDHLEVQLRTAGFGAHADLRLESWTLDEAYDCWTPVRGRIELNTGIAVESLHAFESESDVDRLMLPMGAPGCDVTGPVVFRLRDVEEGCILVTAAPPQADILRRAKIGGAVAVLSSSLASYNVLPGTTNHPENALRLRRHPSGEDLPAAMLSRNSHRRIEAAHRKFGSVEVRLQAEVKTGSGPLRMLVATIGGARQPGDAVVVTSHVGYAGASDNASGVGATLECATLLANAIQGGEMPHPDRSLAFVWGPEVDQSEAWLERSELTPVAALTAIGCGDAARSAGSPQYLERMPDPGALVTLMPDKHTQWGSDKVDPAAFQPNGLALVARCALADMSQHSGGWRTADHPWEGGSDPDAFEEAGVPAVLFWHFTTPWYHTSLDRLDRIDPTELQRSAVATLSTAMALASPQPQDLNRYLSSLQLEEEIRVRAALQAGDEELAERWESWCAGARDWLRSTCGG